MVILLFHPLIPGQIMHRAIFLCALLLGCIASWQSIVAEVAAVDSARTHFQELWTHLRSDIRSADVRFRVYYGVTPNTICTDGQLAELIDKYELAESISRIPEFLAAFAGTTSKLVAPVRIHQQDGDRTRQEFENSIYIEDSDYFFIRKDNNRQISAYFRGGSTIGIPRLNHIRKIPGVDFEPQEITRTGGAALLKTESIVSVRGVEMPVRSEYLCDWDSGIPKQIQYSIQGRLASELRVLNLADSAGDVIFPQCVLDITYDREQATPQVKGMNVYVVEDAQFNRPIPSDAFVMSKPVGVEVLDRRFPDSLVPLGVSKQEISDIRKILPATTDSMPKIRLPDWSMRRRLFFFLNGVVLLVISVWLWRRALRTN